MRASGPSTIVNLRGQAAIAGTAPMNVQVNAVRVGGILSPLISVLRSVLQPGVNTTVCVQVQNLLGLDLTFLGVEMDVTAFNADAPGGVSGRIVVQTGAGGEDISPFACADAVALPPTADAGPDQSIADTDQQAGELVTLNGSGSLDPDGTIASHQWFNAANQQIATGATPAIRLVDGVHMLTLLVTDNGGTTDVDTVTITVTAPATNQLPIARAGADRIVADSDGQAGEAVTLDGTASIDQDGSIASYQWLVGQSTVLATGPNPTVRLPDGPQAITLRVTDNSGGTATDSIGVTVAPPNPTVAPIASAGPDRVLPDTDGSIGETVVLDATGSGDTDGTIVAYQWSLNGQPLATGLNATVRLADGESFITLIVTDDDGNTASDGVLIAVSAAPVVPLLALLPGLTPNQLSVARALDALCPRLSARGAQQQLTENQADLLTRCNGITFASTPSEQVRALDEISPQDLNATRTQSLNLSRSQLANIADRLVALRGGARGLSLAGLNLQIDGDTVPLADAAASIGKLLGGGASADASEADSLLDARLGLWLRGNYSFGEKEGTIADHGFDANQWGLMAGADFRFAPTYVVGVSLGYGQSNVDFSPRGAGDLDTRAITGALYATMYSQRGFFIDAIASYLRSTYDSRRHVTFTQGGTPIDVTAIGDTAGASIGMAFTLGYELTPGAFTIAPHVGYNYLNTGIGRFSEHGARGLDLAYERQSYASLTANAGLRISYAWKTYAGVLVPQVRGEFLREFVDDTDAFAVRFVNDPFDDTPLITVQTEVPDRSYWRLAAGVAAQFKYGVSGFVEYQRLASLQYLDYADVALGLRIETSFR